MRVPLSGNKFFAQFVLFTSRSNVIARKYPTVRPRLGPRRERKQRLHFDFDNAWGGHADDPGPGRARALHGESLICESSEDVKPRQPLPVPPNILDLRWDNSAKSLTSA